MKLLSRIALGVLFSPILIPVLIILGLVLAGPGTYWIIKYILTGEWGYKNER